MRLAALGLLAAGLSGCASKLIGERIGADQVVLAKESEVAKCKSLGRSTLSVLSSLGPLTRSAEAVEDNLLQMARNEAIDKGGDTVVKGNSLEYGKRSYEVFKCK
ncbi:DUF4156 domain-containing protein [Rhodoferax sp. BAB1]|uniref:DUF4156 domain-containing protein n=1 Tax=Rhodoferax sp. BAB1 TaxID=2741720 RepID=UPI0015774E47|nr:DUF4156 domain-containing protein [Rhodoferax sp. BAB1]QKO21232.1 hypothetical protein HTY51_04715 [Rhodoferax sp. BAB1]